MRREKIWRMWYAKWCNCGWKLRRKWACLILFNAFTCSYFAQQQQQQNFTIFSLACYLITARDWENPLFGRTSNIICECQCQVRPINSNSYTNFRFLLKNLINHIIVSFVPLLNDINLQTFGGDLLPGLVSAQLRVRYKTIQFQWIGFYIWMKLNKIIVIPARPHTTSRA